MGSKGGSAAQPGLSLPTPVVCCMCGDLGLSQELFRCEFCLVRSQHKYCSNLYPRIESYRACNWCLKQEAARIGAVRGAATTTTANDNTSPVHCHPSSNNDSSSSAVKVSGGVSPQHLNKAVKKQKVMQQGSPPSPLNKVKIDLPPTRSEGISQARGVGKQAFRGKVRRYKLLEEVSSHPA